MKYTKQTIFLVVILLVAVFLAEEVYSKPFRQKRISDQRLAEIQTYLALSRMKGQMMTVPIGFGKVNVEDIGRRRRSIESPANELYYVSYPKTTCEDGTWKLNRNGILPESLDVDDDVV